MRKTFVAVHSFALAALATVVFLIVRLLDERHALGRLDPQRSPCGALANALDSLECRKSLVVESSALWSDPARFLRTTVILALLVFVAAVHVYSIVFVLKRLRRSPARMGTGASG